MRNLCRSSEYVALLTSLCIMLFGTSHCPAEQKDLLSIVRAGHLSARQSIHSFSATIRKEVTFPNQPELVLTGKYWRSFDVVRIHEGAGGRSEDYLVKDSEIRQVSRGGDPRSGQVAYAAGRKPRTAILSALDVWISMMIDFPGPNEGCYDLDRFLEFAIRPPQASQERKDGHDCIRLDLSMVSDKGLKQDVTLWHDVARNYLVWKMKFTYKPNQFESEILEFTEPLPGVFVPSKCRRQTFRNGEQTVREDVSLSDVQVNEPIPKKVFQLPAIPAETMLDDEIQRTRYPVDENWRPIGPAKPLLRKVFPAKSDTSDDYHSQSVVEPRSLSWWLVPGSLVVLAIACVYRIYRHYQSRGHVRRAD